MNIFKKGSTNKPFQFIIARHGESIWNKENRFTGWTDVPLTRLGRFQAAMMGQTIKHTNHISPRSIFTSDLHRAVETSIIVRANMGGDKSFVTKADVNMFRSWRLNEKNYGDCEGVCRDDLVDIVGKSYVRDLRHNLFMRPPILETCQKYTTHEYAIKTSGYNSHIDTQLGESADDVIHRMLPYWYDTIVPSIKTGACPFIITHRHNARGLLKYLSRMSNGEFERLDIPNSTIYHIKLNDELFIDDFVYDVSRVDTYQY